MQSQTLFNTVMHVVTDRRMTESEFAFFNSYMKYKNGEIDPTERLTTGSGTSFPGLTYAEATEERAFLYSQITPISINTFVFESKHPQETTRLLSNYPNPFNPSTSIHFQLSSADQVRLSVHDLLGREVAILVNETRSPGTHSVQYDASDLASGIYFYRLTTSDGVLTRKMTLIK